MPTRRWRRNGDAWRRADPLGSIGTAPVDDRQSWRTSLERELYRPVKAFLEARGFVVKGEVGGCDLVAIRDGEPPIVVVGELKLRFNMELVLQGVDRATACDEVWLAARLSKRGAGREHDARFRQLCRRLGFGLLGVDGRGAVTVILSPDAPLPRRDPRRRARLVGEHRRRIGDPAVGGGSRAPVMTAYRQQALACAARMTAAACRPRDLAAEMPDAGSILRRNVYGWFSRVERGRYALTDAGRDALARWPDAAASPPFDVGASGATATMGEDAQDQTRQDQTRTETQL